MDDVQILGHPQRLVIHYTTEDKKHQIKGFEILNPDILNGRNYHLILSTRNSSVRRCVGLTREELILELKRILLREVCYGKINYHPIKNLIIELGGDNND